MPIIRTPALVCFALLLVIYGCGRETPDKRITTATTTAAAQGTAGLVGPRTDDASDDIVSWVDGQVVTDWAAEITRRDNALEGYLNDADPGRAAKYGFRSGQNPQL